MRSKKARGVVVRIGILGIFGCRTLWEGRITCRRSVA
jgi:hypothetical protein